MQSAPYRAEAVNRHDIFASLCAASRALVLAITFLGAAVSGCAPLYHDDDFARPRTRSESRVPLPRAALLSPQGAPDCGEAKTADPRPVAGDSKRMASTVVPEPASAAMVPPKAEADRDAELALRVKLEYERECYRQAEIRVRDRLRQLQGSVSETIKSINRTAE
jgi:hypothetical protein